MASPRPDVEKPLSSETPHERGSLIASLVLVAVCAAAIYLPFLGYSRTLTSHEVMVTQPALQILEGDGWIVPMYTSVPWLDKPPLVNWLTAASFAWLGFSEFAARLPAAFSGVLLSLLVALLGWRLWGATAGLLAGLAQATMVISYTYGRLGEIDIHLALLVTACHAVLLWHWRGGRTDLPLPHAIAFHVLAGLAVMTKGPIGAVLPGLTVLGLCGLQRTLAPLRAVLFTPAIIAFFAVTVPWHIAALVVAGQEALRQWFYNNVVRFGGGGFHLGPKSLLYYFINIPWLILPWTPVLIVGGKRLLVDARRPEAAAERFLWVWFLVGLLFLTLAAHKNKQYALPILPPLMLLTGKLLAIWIAEKGTRARHVVTGTVIGMIAAYGIVSAVVMPMRDHRAPTIDFVREACARVPEGTSLYVVGLGQSSIYPYLTYEPLRYLNSKEQVEGALVNLPEEPMWVLTLRANLEQTAEHGLSFEELAAEPVRKKYPAPETLVLGIVRRATTTTTAPAESQPSAPAESQPDETPPATQPRPEE